MSSARKQRSGQGALVSMVTHLIFALVETIMSLSQFALCSAIFLWL